MTDAALAIAEALRVMRSTDRAYLNYIFTRPKNLDKKVARMISSEFKVARTIPKLPGLDSYEMLAEFVSKLSKKPSIKNIGDTAKSIFDSADQASDQRFEQVWQAKKKNGQSRRCYSAISKLYMFHTDLVWPPFDRYAADALMAVGSRDTPRAVDFYVRLQGLGYADLVAKLTACLSEIDDARAERVVDKYLMMTQLPGMKDWAKMWLLAEPKSVRATVNEAGDAVEPILREFIKT